MAGTLNRIWSRQPSETFLLCPSAKEWEIWDLSKNGAGKLTGTCADPSAAGLPSRFVMGIPLREVFALPLWLATTDETLFRDMIFLQLERRGLLARSKEETVMNYRVVTREKSRMLVLVTVLPSTFPEALCIEKVLSCEPSARLFPLPKDQWTFWQEGDRLAVAATRGEELVYFQALGDRTFSASVIHELRCICWQLEAQGVIAPMSGITVWGEIAEPELKLLNEALGLMAVCQPRPAPRLPSQPMPLVPSPVQALHASRKMRWKKLRVAGAVAAIYVLLASCWILQVGWLSCQKWRIERSLQRDAATVQTIRQTAERWQAFDLALNPAVYPVEQLFQCSKLLPAEGLRLTLFEQQGFKLLITGEAKNASVALKFVEDLKKSRDFASYRWQMPQPRLLPNGSALFQMEGVRPHASAN